MKQLIPKINQEILASSKNSGFSGHDPFDALNSRLLIFLPFLRKGIFGLIWTQLHKRSIVNLRPLFGIPKKRNPKGIALFILGLLEDYKRTKSQAYLEQVIDLGNWLLTQQSDKNIWQHACWGYHFDWNARAFYVPKGKPNVITTIYVAQALYALSEVTGEEKYRYPALDAAHFIVKTLHCQHDGREFFAYIPGEMAFVHNASLWGAAWVGFVGKIISNEEYIAMALQVARQSVKEQAEDGSWVYGAREHHQFIDGFHTGYNLEALHLLSSALDTSEFTMAIDKGLAFYKTHLFEQDGTAKYYHNNPYPLDMHCVAQAILTLLKVGGSKADVEMTEKIINQSIKLLYLPKSKHFAYQKHKYFTNKINYMRWTQAWVYYSFAFYNRYTLEQG